MIFRNARLIFPDGVRDNLELEVRGGKITAVRASSAAAVPGSIDLESNYLAPGFVDLHVHGALGSDTMDATFEAFEKVCRHHATGGTTSLLLTTATAPLPTLINVVQAVRNSVPRLKQIAGMHIEGPFISRQKPGAQQADLILDPTPQRYAPLLDQS